MKVQKVQAQLGIEVIPCNFKVVPAHWVFTCTNLRYVKVQLISFLSLKSAVLTAAGIEHSSYIHRHSLSYQSCPESVVPFKGFLSLQNHMPLVLS